MNELSHKTAALSLDSRGLLDRMLDTSHLAHVVPRLSPEVLHRVVQRCGLEDCGELVALATPDQLAGVFDLDLWRAANQAWTSSSTPIASACGSKCWWNPAPTVAAQTLARMDVDLVIAALAHHARVFDPAAVSPSV